MLRSALLAAATLLVAIGAWLCLAGVRPPGAKVLCFGLVLLVGLLVERWRYRPPAQPDAQWQPTGERFIDPASGRRVEVQYDAKRGERRYAELDDDGGEGR